MPPNTRFLRSLVDDYGKTDARTVVEQCQAAGPDAPCGTCDGCIGWEQYLSEATADGGMPRVRAQRVVQVGRARGWAKRREWLKAREMG